LPRRVILVKGADMQADAGPAESGFEVFVRGFLLVFHRP